MTASAWVLLALAGLLGATGMPEAGLFVALASLVVAVLGPSDEQQDARARNRQPQARRIR